jgi:hypothetical protein
LICTLTIVRYPKWFGWAGLLSMAIFRIPLFFNNRISFWKLMGCGKNGTFDKTPDLRQWAVLQVCDPSPVLEGSTANNKRQTTDFSAWWKLFRCEVLTLVLEPIEGHGTWDHKKCFGELPKQTDYEGLIGVLTRASIRMNRLKSFWQNVNGVAGQMRTADGFITSLGIGEVPWIKQATFSIWQSKSHMKQFAYQMKEHTEVIRKTRDDNWYSEEMFVRFKILAAFGSLHGKNPLAGKL